MKNFRMALIVVGTTVAALLGGCGGTTADATIGGTSIGLSGGTTVVLMNNGSDPITIGANGSFSFDVQIGANSSYNVTVETQPVGETCTVINGVGTVDANADQVTNVVVSCVAS